MFVVATFRALSIAPTKVGASPMIVSRPNRSSRAHSRATSPVVRAFGPSPRRLRVAAAVRPAADAAPRARARRRSRSRSRRPSRRTSAHAVSKEDTTAYAFTEEQRHAHNRSVAGLDHDPVAGKSRIEFTLSVMDQDDLALTDTPPDGKSSSMALPAGIGREPPTMPMRSKSCPVVANSARPMTSKSMRGRTASPTRSKTSPTLRLAPKIGGNAVTAFRRSRRRRLPVQHDDGLDEWADEFGDLAANRYVFVGIDARTGAHDDERTDDSPTSVERYDESRPQSCINVLRTVQSVL